MRRIVAGAGPVSSGRRTEEAIALAAAEVVARARSALDRVEHGEPAATLTDEDVSALELIVRTVGRPALRYRNGKVEMPQNALGDNSEWQVIVSTARDTINEVSSRVGRIARDNDVEPALGTGWVTCNDLLVTNRHVARLLVVDPEPPASEWRLDPGKGAFVDFAYTDDTTGPARCEISELVYCAEDRWVDLAAFRIKPGNAPVPPPLRIDWDTDLLGRPFCDDGRGTPHFQGGEIYTVGHPYLEVATDETRSVFGEADGRKRFSPGLVTVVREDKPIFLHDCSTLGGHSGSCVISLDTADHAVVGLHFGGREEETTRGSGLGAANYAITLGRIAALHHRAADILRNGKP